ncbi:MAG TPA: ATP-binding cassette domain-containing protein [Candidatus Corynebacterium gallistercoris]|uniref:Trehalose import ATP-binding protein SugC n=1 Tax=Candidatus Corynebacterium gallistercoris TaxID=2838530 RepID=A0A9D1RVI0_9CORY|nr:ATP-binding cassette domain-containing protein [Candidatus Corynebacterium gallistercoris]
MASVTFDGASRIYAGSKKAQAKKAVDQINLDIADGEFLVLVGPSGCGKSTTLRMLAGLEPTNEGRILIGGQDATGVAPRDRDVAMVFQNYALYPNMTVAQNMAFALRNRGMGKAEAMEKVKVAAQMLELTELLDRKPAQLSGGQRQRVAMGRAIVREPSVFCMDEPLSNLDAKLRVSTRSQISKLQKRLGTTTVYVTHDQVEAMTMGDRVAVMKDGVLQQVASPRELYERPVNAFVASFIGSPTMNFFFIGDGTSRPIWLPESLWVELGERPAGYRVGVRCEDWEIVGAGAGAGETALALRISHVEELGSESFAFCQPVEGAVESSAAGSAEGSGVSSGDNAAGAAGVTAESLVSVRLAKGDHRGEGDVIHVRPTTAHHFCAESGQRL